MDASVRITYRYRIKDRATGLFGEWSEKSNHIWGDESYIGELRASKRKCNAATKQHVSLHHGKVEMSEIELHVLSVV